MNNKLAIVTSGGGMTCSYSVGTLLALVDKYNLTTPDIAIGASGGAGTLAYYVSGQYDSIKNIWTNLLSTKMFINPLRVWKVIDIDYVIDEVFKKQDPLQIDKVYKSSIELLIPCTNIKTGKAEYFTNKSEVDIFEMLRATKAMPIVYGKAVSINGQKYCDTDLSCCVNLNIEKALNTGAKKVLVLDNYPVNPVIENGMSAWLNSRSNLFKENYNCELKRVRSLSFSSNVLFLRPERKLEVSTLNNDSNLLRKTIILGYNESINNNSLEKFLN